MRFLAQSLVALVFLACAPAFAEEQPPARVGRVSAISGTLASYGPGETEWSAAKVNYPVATGGWFATDPQSRAEIRIGAETIDTVSVSARTLIKSAAEVGGDIGTVARNTVEGAIAGAKQVGLNVEEAASAAATGAIKGAGEVSQQAVQQARNAVTGVIAGVKVVLKEPFK